MKNNLKPPYLVKGKEDCLEAMDRLIGQTVRVSWTAGNTLVRSNFDTQISVIGELEGNCNTGKFRVLMNDDAYTYFYDDHVLQVGQDVGKSAVIFIGDQ